MTATFDPNKTYVLITDFNLNSYVKTCLIKHGVNYTTTCEGQSIHFNSKNYKLVKLIVNDAIEIKTVLNKIKEQGLSLTLCDYFIGVNKYLGKKYFNVELDKTLYDQHYSTLEGFIKYGIIKGIEPNGVTRVAIYF